MVADEWTLHQRGGPDLRFLGLHLRSPWRYFGCLTFNHLSV